MRQMWKRCYEAAALIMCLLLLAGYGKCGAGIVPLDGAGIRVSGFLRGRIDNPWNRNRQYEEMPAAELARKREEQQRENEENFYEIAAEMGISRAEAEAYYLILDQDNVFEDGVMDLAGYAIHDFDQNGQKDMAVMLENTEELEENGVYGTGCIYFYMNGEEPYCFQDENFPFHFGLYLYSADLDNDGNIELIFEARGTGNGGSGDWYNRVLKYKDHTMTKMELPTEHEGETELDVQVAQEMQKDTYSAYCPYLDETVVFHAQNVFEPHENAGGANCRGFYDLRCVEYKGGQALEASEYLYGEGGIAHCVGIAKFIIVWDEDGNSRVDQWWVEPMEDSS